MDIQTAGNFLGAALLFGTGFAFIGIVIVFLNNIIHMFWKPLNWFKFMNFTDEKQYPKPIEAKDMKEPILDDTIQDGLNRNNKF